MTAVISIRKIALTLCCTLLLTACIAEDVSMPEADRTPERSMLLELNVRASADEDGSTAAAEAEPEAYESKLHSIRIYAYTRGELVVHHHIADIDEAAAIPYTFLMDIAAKTTKEQPVNFYVIANEEGLSGLSATLKDDMSEDALNGLTFGTLNDLTDTTSMKMPNITKASYWIDMSDESSKPADGDKYPDHAGHTAVARVYKDNNGVIGDELTTTDEKGNTVSAGSIPFLLERPTSKLRIFAASLDANTNNKMTIVSAKLIGGQAPTSSWLFAHSDAALLAREYETIDEVEITLSDESTKTTGCKYFDPDNKNDAGMRTDKTYYTEVTSRAYYPLEIPFGSEPANWESPTYYDTSGNIVTDGTGQAKGNILEIKYSFDGGVTTRTGKVYLPPMKRNHYYAVYCLMNNGGQFTIEYTVAEWEHDDDTTTNNDDWELDFAYPSYSPLFPAKYSSLSDALEAAEDGSLPNPQCWYVSTPTSKFDGCFTAKFVITAPVGVEVSPTVDKPGVDVEIWKGTEDNEYRVMEVDEDGIQTTTPVATMTVCDSSDPYILVVRPNGTAYDNGEGEAFTFNLMISWRPTWDVTESLLLLINQGANGGVLWKGSGDKTNMIEIEYLTGAPE